MEPLKASNSLLLDDFWAELDDISESGDASQPYCELEEDSPTNKSLEG